MWPSQCRVDEEEILFLRMFSYMCVRKHLGSPVLSASSVFSLYDNVAIHSMFK